MYGATTAVRKGGEAGSVSGAEETAAKCWLGEWQTEWKGSRKLSTLRLLTQQRSPQSRGGAWEWGGRHGYNDGGRRMGMGRPKWKRRISSASRQLKRTTLISLSEINTGLEIHCLKQEHQREKGASTHRVINSALKKRGRGCAHASQALSSLWAF